MPESLENIKAATQELVYYEERVIDHYRETLRSTEAPESITSQAMGAIISPHNLTPVIRSGWQRSEYWVGTFLCDLVPGSREPIDTIESPNEDRLHRLRPELPVHQFWTDFFNLNGQMVNVLCEEIGVPGLGIGELTDLSYISYAESLILRSAVYQNLLVTTQAALRSAR